MNPIVDVAQVSVEDASDEAMVRQWAQAPRRDEVRQQFVAATSKRLAETGRGLQLTGGSLAGLNLEGLDLRGAVLNRAVLHGTNLSHADLRGASLICPGIERARFRGANLEYAYLHAFAAQVCDFDGANLSSLVDGTGALFHGCSMNGTSLERSSLSGSSFYQSVMDEASFAGAQLQGCQFIESSCVRTKFERCNVDETTFTRVDLRGATFRHACGAGMTVHVPCAADGLVLESASLPGLHVRGLHAGGVLANGLAARESDWKQCSITDLGLDASDLSESSWTDVSAPRVRLVGALLTGARWTRVHVDGGDLTGAHGENWTLLNCSALGACLRDLRARCLHVRTSDLGRTDLRGAYLYRAMITGDPPQTMLLKGADLSSAVLVQSYVSADLRGANLRGVAAAYARLNQCRFDGAILDGGEFFQASLVKTRFDGASLRGVKPPMFVDRCPGLTDALDAGGEATAALRRHVAALASALSLAPGGST